MRSEEGEDEMNYCPQCGTLLSTSLHSCVCGWSSNSPSRASGGTDHPPEPLISDLVKRIEKLERRVNDIDPVGAMAADD